MEESDFLKAESEDKERREILQEVIKEIHLFNLRQDEEDTSESHQTEDSDSSELRVLHPPGIKFFEGYVNAFYDEESIRPELFSKLFEDVKDVSLLYEVIEWRARYDILVDPSFKKDFMKYFFKLLFTEQSEELLHIISSTLLEMISKSSKPCVLLKMFMAELPCGIVNLGGRVDVIDNEEERALPTNRTPSHRKEEFSFLRNLKYILEVIKYTIVKGNNFSKEKVAIPIPEIDRLFFIVLVISHDPVVLMSSLVAAIQDFLATVLDLYPPNLAFSQEKVQDLVERLAIYWEDSPQGFNHHTASYVTCNVLPLSKRGQHLKGSLAYYALMCCLTPVEEEVEVVDFVTISKLSEFCQKHADDIKILDSYTVYSVIKLIDAGIVRPFDKTHKEQLMNMKELLITNLSLSRSQDVHDFYNSTRLNIFVKEINSQWERLLIDHKPQMKQLTIPCMITPKHSTDDFS